MGVDLMCAPLLKCPSSDSGLEAMLSSLHSGTSNAINLRN